MSISAIRSVTRQALFTGIRANQSMTMARATLPLIASYQQQVRTFVPVIVPIYNWGSTPKKPKKDEEDYEQEFDFTVNPLFQCNPTGVNDTVNAGSGVNDTVNAGSGVNDTVNAGSGVNDTVNAGSGVIGVGTSQVPYKVRMLINGLASTDRNIYKLTDPTLLPADRREIIKQYELATFTKEELALVRGFMDQIGNQTEREYRLV